jgi:hypothetical protein
MVMASSGFPLKDFDFPVGIFAGVANIIASMDLIRLTIGPGYCTNDTSS